MACVRLQPLRPRLTALTPRSVRAPHRDNQLRYNVPDPLALKASQLCPSPLAAAFGDNTATSQVVGRLKA